MSSAAPGDFQLWQPPDGWSPERPASTSSLPIWLVAGGVVVLSVLGILAVGLGTPTRHRPLPRTYAEMTAAEGTRIPVGSGTTLDNRTYSVEVSVMTDGRGFCDFLTVDAPPGGGGTGGGGCGSATPFSFSFGGDGIVHGITDRGIMSVDVLSAAGTTTVATKSLPSQFGGRRHFVALLPAGIPPTSIVGHGVDGRVIARQKVYGG